jgi:hypothetical protein
VSAHTFEKYLHLMDVQIGWKRPYEYLYIINSNCSQTDYGACLLWIYKDLLGKEVEFAKISKEAS